MRTALLVTGVSIGLGAIAGQPLLRSTVIAAEELTAATVEEAAKVLDLNTLPLAEGAKVPFGRHLGLVSYEVGGDSKTAFQFHQKQLTKLGWKELPGTSSQAEYISATFQKNGFMVSVTSYAGGDPNKPNSATVTLSNLGNVPLSKLPAVKGAKQVFVSDVTATYSTALKPADAVTATRKLLTDAGWEPYGSNSNPPDSEVMMFKRNAVRLTAFVGVHPAQKDHVMVSYSSTLLSADIPAPTNAKEVGFDDAEKTLRFQTSESFDTVATFYLQRLAKQGWKPDTKELYVSKANDRQFGQHDFRNGAKDHMSLLVSDRDGMTHVMLTLRTVADVAALKEQLRVATENAAAEEKAQKAAAEAEAKVAAKKPAAKKPAADSDDGFPDVDALIKSAVGDALKDAGLDGKKPAKGASKVKAADKDAVSVPIPDGAKKVTQTSGNVLQIKWPANKGKPSAEALRDQLLAAGWEIEDDAKIDKTSGNVTFTKDGKTLTMSFVDTGLADVNMMLIGIGVKLAEGKADPDAKVPVASAKPKSSPKTDSSDDDPIKTLKKKPRSKSSKSDSGNKPTVKLPPRAEKPIRGIAKLDKLTNEVKLIADGKTVVLPHIIAYESAADGHWVTRILATETPIKQSSLIALLRKNGSDHEFKSQSPRVLVELDDQDQPINMSYAGNGSLGSASGSGLTGEAIVEEGRARGTFKAKKESEFFGKTIIGEITFDVPLLTRDSQPERQLANVKKLETVGNLVVNNKTMKLANFAAYQVKSNDEVRTVILFNEKPINMAKLKESLAKDGSDDGNFDFSSHVKVTIDKDDKLDFLNLYTDGASVSQNTGLIGNVIVEDGRARGTVKLDKAIDFAGKNINFDLTFDVDVLTLPATAKE